jgi:hypothetical protein
VQSSEEINKEEVVLGIRLELRKDRGSESERILINRSVQDHERIK